MSDTPRRPGLGAVLAVAGAADDGDTLRAAAALAARHGAALSVLGCVEPPPDLAALARATGMAPAEMLERMGAERRARLAEDTARDLPGAAPELHVAVGKPFVEIIRHAMRHGADMVVKTAEPLAGLDRLLFASTDQHLVRKCPCPVWLRLPGARPEPRTVLAAVDVDDWDASEPETLAGLNRRVIETGLRLAAGPDAVLHVLHAWDAPGEVLIWNFTSRPDPRAAAESYVREVQMARSQALEALVWPIRTGLAPGEGPRIVSRLARGAARDVIAEEARAAGADVVVMGTVARTGLGGILIGNTAEDMLNRLHCSVMAVKPEGFVSPIGPEGATA